jgi:hypothetical protein
MVTNALGQTTNASVTLTVLSGPAVAAQPLPSHALFGTSVCLPAAVSGAQPMGFQWYQNGVMLTNDGRISGATLPTLGFNVAEYQDSGNYTLMVTNAFGSITGLVANVIVTPILAWGDDSAGQLDMPVEATNILTVTAGADHNLALRADGGIVAWGDNSFGQINVPSSATNIVAIAAGENHSLALLKGGTVLAWGDNSLKQTEVPSSVTNAVAIAAGNFHSLALLRNGSVISWGGGNWPFGTTNVPAMASNVVAIAGGNFQSMALRRDGTVVCWWGSGRNLGPASATNVVAIAAGDKYFVALRADGTLVGWGNNVYESLPGPVSVTNPVAVSVGGDHSLALQVGGTIAAWGGEYDGQVDVPATATNIIAVSGGGAHSLALVSDGSPVLSAPLSQPKFGANSFSVSLPTQNGRVFVLEYKKSLTDSNWTALPLAAGVGGIQILTDTTATNSQRFYRVRRW